MEQNISLIITPAGRALVAKLVTKYYGSRTVGGSRYIDRLISGNVLIYIPIMDYRAYICDV